MNDILFGMYMHELRKGRCLSADATSAVFGAISDTDEGDYDETAFRVKVRNGIEGSGLAFLSDAYKYLGDNDYSDFSEAIDHGCLKVKDIASYYLCKETDAFLDMMFAKGACPCEKL